MDCAYTGDQDRYDFELDQVIPADAATGDGAAWEDILPRRIWVKVPPLEDADDYVGSDTGLYLVLEPLP